MSAPRSWQDVARGYDAAADAYDERHGARRDRARAAILERPMLEAVRGARRVLEVGVGTGRVLAQVAAAVRVGADVSSAMLAVARRRGLAVVRADAHRLPFAAGSFDGALAGGAVFRYLDAPVALAELARVLVPGAALAIHQLGARTWGPRGARRPDPRVHELARADELDRPARAAGFAVERAVRWRTTRVPPYAIEVPAWLDRRCPVQLWSHVVLVLRRH